MIPHRMLSNEISNSGLRDRVTACRKRLRERRVMLKALATMDVEELFPEATAPVSRLDYNRELDECFAPPASVGHMSGSPFDGAERVEEQEVGIT
jgi:hypothetical protein